MSLENNALVTTTRMKAYINESGSSFDTILEVLINAVSSLFDICADRNLREQTYATLYLDGNGERELQLPDWPVAAITVTEDDLALTEGIDEDYILYADEGYLYKNGGNWTKNRKGIKLTAYKAGFQLIESRHFDSGSEEPKIADTLVGADSAAEGIVSKVVFTKGIWGSGTAEGWIEFSSVTGTFEDNENINIKDGSSNVMTVNEPDAIINIPKDLELACMKQVAKEWKRQDKQEWGEASRSFGEGSISISIDELLDDVKATLDRYVRL